MKKIIFILLFIATFNFAFADTYTHFFLRHVVNVDSECYFEFWSPGTNRLITEAVLSESNRTVFSTLAIIYNTSVTINTITVSFTPLINTADNSYCDYTIEVLKPNTNTHLVEVAGSSTGHGSGEASLLSKATTFNKYSSDMWNTDEIADFAITINSENSNSGDYEATMKCTFIAN